jgi:hypothetical protein
MGRLSGYPLDAVEESNLYPSTFSIYRASRTLTSHGATPMTWSLVDTAPGRVRELNAHERLQDDVRKDKLTHRCYCAPDADIVRNDVIVVSPPVQGGVNTFLVVHAHLPDNIMHHYEITAKTIVSGSAEWAGYMI